ncbi:MAG: hypothetical protein COC23_06035 [Hyphomicrobiales bacterium]|nr:MAG: hypothetical protein COC23_06035 [Hyphomicrobiales bacterium]
MLLFFSALFRIIILSLSFIVATLAAAIFIAFILFLEGDASWLFRDALAAGGTVAFAGVTWFNITSWAFAPAALILLALEFGRLSSLMINLLAGGACAVIVMIMFNPSIQFENGLAYDPQQLWMVAIAAGFIAGFTHWLLAGHRAGRWMGPADAPQLD